MTTQSLGQRRIRVAVIGAGPAGCYAADILTTEYPHADVDILERLPAPYGLVRYGVAPDHPRIKEIIKALGRILNKPDIRFLGNVDFGGDLKLSELGQFYDAVIIATGARYDRPLEIPGVDLPGSYGAADFVAWYDGHPDVPRDWPLTAQHVAVIGAGNVALDISRMLAKTADEQLPTEIADNVHSGLSSNRATDIHVFARRGPAQIKFTPMELRELAHSPNVDVLVHPEGFDVDAAGEKAIQKSKQTKMVVDTLLRWLDNEPTGKAHRIHLHFCAAPVQILGETAVTGLRTERTELTGDGSARPTGDYTDWPVEAVYRAVGYISSAVPDLPFDEIRGVIPSHQGRVLDLDDVAVPGVYTTGWIKRGPVGLIGHTKSDAAETVRSLLADLDGLTPPRSPEPGDLLEDLASKGVAYTTLEGWHRLDAHERSLGESQQRERIKVVPREEMITISRTADLPMERL